MKKTIQNRDIIDAFYKKCFNDAHSDGLESRVRGVVAEDWAATPTVYGGDGVEGLTKTLRFLASEIPDLRWTPQEIIECDDKVVVRSLVTGTPKNTFMGVEPLGSFSINAIDIHYIKDGQIARTFRVEDWGRAREQIKRTR
jgi:predicted ester cyclase